MSRELTDKEIERQDVVDDEIYDLICNLFPFESLRHIEWDIEEIGEIRDILINIYESVSMAWGLEWNEKEFYPYIEWDDEEKEVLNGKNNL
jgi:hypothetical protein